MSNEQRKLVYNVAASLDGFITGPEQSVDFYSYEGDHVADYMAALRSYSAVIMGRRTYESGLKNGVTDPYPFLETYVVSRSLSKLPNERVRLVREGAADLVRELKRTPGADMYLCGGGALAATLFEEGLIDELIVKVNPVLAGAGTSLVERLPAPQKLTLVSTMVYQSGVVTVRYLVTGG